MQRRQFLGASTTALLAVCAPRAAFAKTFPVTRTEAEWRARLSPAAYAVLRENGTEPAFSHPYHAQKADGVYRCAGCESPVYASSDKFASDTGWPAFDRYVDGQVLEGPDPIYGAFLVELHCATCGSHLGHIFNDGPEETTGERHCINGLSLAFEAAEA